MFSLIAAQLAKPAIRYGFIVGGVVLLVGSIWWHGYETGKESVQEEWNAAIAKAAANAVHESIKADAMESAVVKQNDQAERVIEAKAGVARKEIAHHAKKDPKPLSVATVAIYDRLISLPNEAGRRVPAADPGPGAPEIPRAGLAVEATTRIQDADDNSIELTTEELAQAAVDFAEKYALIKNAYKGLSDWNDGRERLELERVTHE